MAGTTASRWGAGMLPFSIKDFENGKWPVTFDEINKYLIKVEKYFDLNSGSYLFKDNLNNINEKILITENKSFYEATLLKLNCEKSQALLNWHSSLDYKDTIKFISEWYVGFYKKTIDMNETTDNQISKYQNIAKSKYLEWTA